MTEKEQRIREAAMIALPVCLQLSVHSDSDSPYVRKTLHESEAISTAISIGIEFEKQFSERVEVPISPKVSTNQTYNTTSTM